MIRTIAFVLAAVLITLGMVMLIIVFKRRFNPQKFKKSWQELQKFCASRETWPIAIISADKLLDEALLKRHQKGKSMGERLVSAQKLLSNNDAVWFAHNLAKKLRSEESPIRLSQADVKKSLVGFRQALKDLGALNDEKQN